MTFLSSMLFAENILGELQKNGLVVRDKYKFSSFIHIKREESPICTDEYIKPDTLFGDNFAGRRVADICKKTFVTQIGVLQPMYLGKDIKTVGELEVLLHIKNAQEKPSKYVLVDARSEKWFKQMTIPTSDNLPFNEIKYIEDVEEDDFDSNVEYERYKKELETLCKVLNIKQRKEGLDFSKAKTVLLYCNASWCSQSPNAIYKLINMGYPREKILWYRGGLQDWLIYDYTVTRSNR
jgi:rhodanese-related sulfurtransferase